MHREVVLPTCLTTKDTKLPNDAVALDGIAANLVLTSCISATKAPIWCVHVRERREVGRDSTQRIPTHPTDPNGSQGRGVVRPYALTHA